ncbi:DNRLRE domain-containing protein [Actinopolymorpha sp. B9G3]|uniref:DNRLRE domain-containing protein n=1 Tax=Actinopolymorpha sp. B9G3 TaxID=3158970 RepID=UPI0032D9A8D8
MPRRVPVPVGEALPEPRRVRELTGRRSASGKVFELADGRVQAELSAAPVHYRDAGGDWREIDTSVRPSTRRPGFVVGNESNAFGSFFGDSTDRLMRFEHAGRSLSLGLPGEATVVRPVVEGSTVTYPDVAGSADVSYEVGTDGLKENIVLESAPADGQDAVFTFTLHAGGGIEARQDEDGWIGFWRKGVESDPLWVMPKPFMYDAADDAESPYGKVWSDQVTQTLDQQGSEVTVTVRADGKWLSSSARKFPVVVDPTIKIVPNPADGQDALIQSGTPTTNFGDGGRLSVGTTDTQIVRSLVQFDVSQVQTPGGADFQSAELMLYFDQAHTTNDFDVEMEARRVDSPWNEATVTWNSINAAGGAVGHDREIVDNSSSGRVSWTGAWPESNSGTLPQYAVGGGYQYNLNATSGETFTWVPNLALSGNYEVEAHYVPSTNRPTNASYTVHYDGGSQAYSVDQTAGSEGVWTTLGTKPFVAGSSHKVVLRDSTDSTKATIADAVQFTKWGRVTKLANRNNRWHAYAVTSTVRSWIEGTAPNHGFMIKATDESVLGRGGPRYLPSEYIYQDETAVRPKLVLTYGEPGVELNPIRKSYSTGAALSWSAYQDPSGAAGDDIVEYQVHRTQTQHFVPSAATLVAPVAKTATGYTDTSAIPTPADSTDPVGTFYYYMVAVKRKDGTVVPSTTQLARLPKAGRIMQILQLNASDTTISSTLPTQNLNVFDGEPWLMVGNNSSTYGKTRVLVEFPDLSAIPSGVTVTDADLMLWKTEATGSGATVDAHALTAPYAETTATWNQAATGDAWTPGGEYDPQVGDSVSGIDLDPKRHTWWMDDVVQGWVDDPASNHGLLLKVRDESASGPQQRAIFLSGEFTRDLELRPQLVVQYLEKTTESTYYAPDTPAQMTEGQPYATEVSLTNTTATTWPASSRKLSYHWALPDGTDVTTAENRLETTLPEDVSPGETVTVNAQVEAPVQAETGNTNKREAAVLQWDLRNTSAGQWLSESADQIPSLDQHVAVEDPTSDELGLERWFSYAGTDTGAGSAAVTNLHSGNTVWSYDAFTNPSRGLSTFVRMSYNSTDTSTSSMGYGWSLQASTLMRLGSPLDFHPNPNPTKVTLTDGDGTSHFFTWNGSEWVSPAGVHLYLQRLVTCAQNTQEDRAWVMTRPDRTEFYFDCDGYLSAVVDNNGNEMLFTYEHRKSMNKPVKFLKYITDPTGRETLSLDYYEKGEDYTWIDDTGAEQSGTNLTNPHIIDQVASLTDISGRTVTFAYTDKGLMAKMVDGAGAGASVQKVFRFDYDADQGNKNVKLVAVTDPRGNTTDLAYYDPPGDDPQFHWWNKSITDRRDSTTAIAYTDPDGPQGDFINTVVTDPMTHDTSYQLDNRGRATQITNAKSESTALQWDSDNNVSRLEEDNGAVSTWVYDPKTGYPTEVKDPKANSNAHVGTRFTYDPVALNGHVVDLATKTSPEGRQWAFDYNLEGDLTSVTDPAGTATATPVDDFQTTHTYDTWGQLLTSTDANGNTSTFADYDDSGYPQTIDDADPDNDDTTFVYDIRGQVTEVTDAAGKVTTQDYDVFGRPGENVVPKDQAAGEFITTPAPEYDANDNITTATAPNGAISTAVYSPMDELVESNAPVDEQGDPARKTVYTYNKVGLGRVS